MSDNLTTFDTVPAPGRWTRAQWFLIIMISLMHGLNHAFYQMIAPLFVAMQKHFGFARLLPAMAIGTAFLFPYAISHLLYGWLADKANKSRIIGFGGLGASLCLAAAGVLPRYGVVMAAVAAAGILAATYHGVSAALITIMFPRSRGRALGIAGIGAALGLTAAPAVSGWIAQRFSWQTSFLSFGILGAAFSLAFLALVREQGSTPQRTDTGAAVGRALWTTVALIMLLMGLREFCGWGSFSLVPTFAQKVHSYTITQAGYVAACVTLAGLVAGPLFGVLSDRLGRLRVLFPLLVLSTASILIIPLLGPFALPVGALVFGLFYTATVPVLDAYIGDVVPDHLKGRIFSITVAAGIGVGSLSPIATAAVADLYDGAIRGFQIAFAMLAAGTALSIIPLTLLRKR